MALGMKTNLKNHYYYNANPYQGSSIQENIGHVTEEEDVRTVDKCMFPEDLAARGERKLAIMYCYVLRGGPSAPLVLPATAENRSG